VFCQLGTTLGKTLALALGLPLKDWTQVILILSMKCFYWVFSVFLSALIWFAPYMQFTQHSDY
jgi:hypothetical protein